MKLILASVFYILISVQSQFAQGSIIAEYRDFEDLTSTSKVIIQGTVSDSKVLEVNGKLYTKHIIKTNKTWGKTNLLKDLQISENEFCVLTMGGSLNGKSMVVHGEASIQQNENVILFIENVFQNCGIINTLSLGKYSISYDSKIFRDEKGLLPIEKSNSKSTSKYLTGKQNFKMQSKESFTPTNLNEAIKYFDNNFK